MSLGNRHNQHSFATVPQVHMARSKFDRSFAAKDTHNFDKLNPVFVEEVLPGDTINLNVRSFIRLAPQIRPIMDNLYVDWFFFYVPNRLTWVNFQKQMGQQDNPGDSTDYLTPQITAPANGFDVGSVYDKLGIPTGKANIKVSALPFRAMVLIRNEWFRDQNLQTRINFTNGDGPDSSVMYNSLNAMKKHDYFTSCLPWPQKGAAIELPLGQTAPVLRLANAPGWRAHNGGANTVPNTAQDIHLAYFANNTPPGQPERAQLTAGSVGPAAGISLDPMGGLYADLSDATAATINQFRQAIMMQSLLELDARGGTRYVEILRAHFNVVSPDARLQRPEFLSGGTTQISQHIVAQNSASTPESPQANLSAFSTGAVDGNKIGFTKSFVEHGYVIGLMRARADITYQQGLNRMWSRRTRWDYFWPKLQELGEQSVLNKEIYADGTSADEEIFGYQERYAEYRYRPSEIRGQFRSTFAESLDVWHLAEEFATRPALNSSFIVSKTPMARVLEVTDPNYPHLLCDFWFDLKHTRPMAVRGIPATLGRF